MLPELSHRMSYAPKSAPVKVVARVPIPDSVALTKGFSFAKYGSVEAAIAAAFEFTMQVGTDAWGDKFKTVGYMRKHGGQNKGQHKDFTFRVGHTVGVSHKIRFKNDVCYYAWTATWVADGVSTSKEFRYGLVKGVEITPESARMQAIACRQEKTATQIE